MRISGITYVPRKVKRTKGIVLTIIIMLLTFVSIFLIVTAYSGWKLTHPPKKKIVPFTSNIVPEFKDASFTDINRKVNLKGWFFQSKGSDKTIIFVHDNGNNRLQFEEKTLDLVKSFLYKGFNVLLFDLRNSGLSGGTTSTMGINEKYDLQGAIKYVKNMGSKQIILMGFSTGASTCMLTASEDASGDITAVIADSPYISLSQYVNDNLPAYSGLPEYFNKPVLFFAKMETRFEPGITNTTDILKDIAPRPVLFIHGRKDKIIPVSSSEELYKQYLRFAVGKIYFWDPQNAGHLEAFIKFPDEYTNMVLDFLQKYIK